MATIIKELKYGKFLWDDEKKHFVIGVNDETGRARHIVLNKVYAFAFMRFVVRIAQRNWFRKRERGR